MARRRSPRRGSPLRPQICRKVVANNANCKELSRVCVSVAQLLAEVRTEVMATMAEDMSTLSDLLVECYKAIEVRG